MSRWHSANVIQVTPGLSQLWRFTADGDKFAFDKGQTFLPSEVFPPAVVGKNWRSLARGKFNLAWLPPEKVFLRVVQLPPCDAAEVFPMIELQLEKLSPLPVAQIVWGLELLPKPADKPDALQTVLVIIVARSYVEEYLGGLEAKGYLADCLEVPCIDQLLNTKPDGNGVWIYIRPGGEPALIAWWYGGVLQNVALISLAEGEDGEKLLKSQLEQMAWSGELEGWLTEPPTLHLVAEPSEVAVWEPSMRTWTGNAFHIVPAADFKELAASSASRAVRPESRSSLLPPEYTKRYRQQFVDGLWMRGLLALLAVYALGVVAYMTALFVLNTQNSTLQTTVNSLSGSYTNALRDKARIQIIKDRQELKYAALDCWKAVARNLPESMTLEDMNFQRGRLNLHGTVPKDSQLDVTTFNETLRKETLNGEPLFSEVSAPSENGTATMVEWRFSCVLKGEGSK